MILNLFKSFFVFIHQKQANNKTTGPQCVKLQARRVVLIWNNSHQKFSLVWKSTSKKFENWI